MAAMEGNAKAALRAKMRQLRSGLGAEARAEADALIAAGVLSLPEYASCDLLLSYLDFGDEVATRAILDQAWAAGKLVALPRCVPGSRELRWHEVECLEGLARSSLGMLEPDPDVWPELLPDAGLRPLCLVPALTFDEFGLRLGYGGGFYDNLLASFDGIAVGLCREAQMSEDLRALGAAEPHDMPVDIVVTDERIIRVGA